VGTLEEILETPGHHVFIVRGAQGEVLIPASKETVTAVDLPGKTMTVRWTADVTSKETTRVAL